MERRLAELELEARHELDGLGTETELAAWRSEYLGRKGRLTALLRQLGTLTVEEIPLIGRRANDLKRSLAEEMQAKAATLRRFGKEPALDVGMPGRAPQAGGLHPITLTMRRMRAAFGQMGFQVFDGPDVETDEYNFTLLNLPPFHPARDSHDTFYTSRPDLLLRTHTSPAQIRVMRKTGAPVRAVVPGTCYRHDQPDASHNWMFRQMEGFAVGPTIGMADLLGAIRSLLRMLFGEESRIRFRGHYFPFTEPSIETDLECTVCRGAGCRLCKGQGWVEIIPGGMIHPHVLRNGGIDPAGVRGFAFGAGVDRIAALLHRIPDIRVLYENDLRFLEQF